MQEERKKDAGYQAHFTPLLFTDREFSLLSDKQNQRAWEFKAILILITTTMYDLKLKCNRKLKTSSNKTLWGYEIVL